jgi:Gas vesicle synthesis protein GvpL/GvpF
MAALTSSEPGTGYGPVQEEQACWYVYGIVPADVELVDDSPGVGDPAGRVQLIRYGEVAALVSEISPAGELGTPEDVRAHARLLDATAAEVPVLPLRFGAVMASGDAVAEELLAPHHDDFTAALTELEGHAEFVVKGRYVEQVVLAEVLAQIPDAARLAEEIKGTDEAASRPARVQLGEIINDAIAARRQADTETLGDAVAPFCVASVVCEPAHELDAASVALLIEVFRRADLEQVVTDLAQEWEGRVELRLLGPLAPWDFVLAPAAEDG